MRQVLNTSKGCPIVQLYLETGQWPARFEVQKSRLLFLKSIMGENEDSMIFKFFKLQLEQPIKGDWVSACQKDLHNLEINQTFDEIRNMPTISFKKLVKAKIKEKAFTYLLNKRGSKGKKSNIRLLKWLNICYHLMIK